MTDFDYSKVYTAVNANKLKIGSKVICSFSISDLKERVKEGEEIGEVFEIYPESFEHRFRVKFDNNRFSYPIAYLVSEPEEKKLKWTDLKVGDKITTSTWAGIRTAMVTVIDDNDDVGSLHVFAGCWLKDEELESYIKLEED